MFPQDADDRIADAVIEIIRGTPVKISDTTRLSLG
jgi:hypothetical protein